MSLGKDFINNFSSSVNSADGFLNISAISGGSVNLTATLSNNKLPSMTTNSGFKTV